MGVSISNFFLRGRCHFWPNCGRMAARLKINLRLSSTPMTAAAAATAAAIKILGYIALIGYIWGY